MTKGTAVATNRSQPVPEIYPGLRFLLDERGLTVADLARRVAELGAPVDARTPRRLPDPDRPLKTIRSTGSAKRR